MNEIYKRRSAHDGYDGTKKVVQGDIEKILKAAMNAPSALNSQPWEFVVVKDPVDLADLTPGTSSCATASHAILRCANTDKYGYQGLNMGMAAQNMMLEATNLGISSLFMGVWPNDEVQTKLRERFGLPGDMNAYGLISFGYHTETLAPNDRWLPERVHYEKY